jgi:hypothetical protein
MSLAPFAPAIAIIAFAAAGAAAQGAATARANAIEDVQVGESGKLLRVALICRSDCRVGARAGGVFYLPGVRSDLDIDLAGRSRNARGLQFQPVEGGSTMTIRADAAIVSASIKPCAIRSAPASCIDLEFSPGAARLAAAPPPAAKPAPSRPAGTAQAAATARAPEPPPLREAPGQEKLTLARFAPPERFTAPDASLPAPSAPAIAGSAARRPIIDREKAAALIGEKFDIAATAEEILGRKFGVAECSGAEARLRNDAWALDAMVNVGFCAAADGDLEAADSVFIRLLEYTPDNYEALVGRALIAAQAGEKSIARKYFQDALNAPPPIAESGRIIKAMAEL